MSMFRAPGLSFSGWLLVLLAIVVTGQPPVQSYLGSDHVRNPSAGGSVPLADNELAKGLSDRGWDRPADKESTSNLILESIGSLLQTWGSTRRRNGEQPGEAIALRTESIVPRSRSNSHHASDRYHSIPWTSLAGATFFPRVAGPQLRVLLHLFKRDGIYAHVCHHP